MPGGLSFATAALSAGTKFLGSNKSSKLSNRALAQQQANLDKVWNNVDPWLQAGKGALGNLTGSADDVLGDFYASPDYAFRKGEAMDSILTNRATNGLLRSGSALKAVSDRIGNMASGEFNNWWAHQAGLAGGGLTANQIGAGLVDKMNSAIATNAQNQAGAAAAKYGALGQLGGSLIDLLGGGGGGDSAGSLAGSGGSSYDAGDFGDLEGLF